MGKLVTETPFSEITATLELLDRFGVARKDLTHFRKASSSVQMEVARLMKHGEQKSFVGATLEIVDGVTHITVTSDGRTDEDFIRMWEEKYRPTEIAKDITRRARFTPTTGVTYRIPIIMGSEFSGSKRLTSEIRKEAERRHYRTLPFEAACLLREAVSDEDLERLGLVWLVGMHDPVLDSDRRPCLLGVGRGDGGRRVSACSDRPGRRWGRGSGFAFLAPQV